MKAIILAAGIGSRLRPVTNDKPKTLVNVNGKPILGHVLDALKKNGITDIAICIGFMSEAVINYCDTEYPNLNFTFVDNKRYDQTNNMFSLYMARSYMDDDILLMNGDVVFDEKIINTMATGNYTSVATDSTVYYEESMKVVVEKGRIVHISKKIARDDSYGCSIDLYRIQKPDVSIMIDEMKRIIEVDGEENKWTEVMLDSLFSSGKLVAKPCDIGGLPWFEIDNFDDLAKAEVIFNDKLRHLKDRRIYFIDRDGTLSLQNEKIPFCDAFIDQLKNKKKIFYVLSNNSSKTPEKTLESLRNIGYDMKENQVLVSIDVALSYLRENDFLHLFWVANDQVSKYIIEKGFMYDESNPRAVLLTYDTELTYDKVVKLVNCIRKGIPYFATHTDFVCPTPYGDIPDIGTFIAMVETTTGKVPNKTFGKPRREMIDGVLKRHGLGYSDAVIIGDRLYTDIKMSENTDICSVLVLTGETKREAYESSDIRADIIVPTLNELVGFI